MRQLLDQIWPALAGAVGAAVLVWLTIKTGRHASVPSDGTSPADDDGDPG